MTPKVYDCFNFYNELEILKLRLKIMNDVVDKFVLVECRQTYSGQEKPLYYQDNKDQFSQWSDKIVHVISEPGTELLPGWDMHWSREIIQRNHIGSGLDMIADKSGDDIIIVSDVDEIVSPKVINKYIETDDRDTCRIRMLLYHYYLNLIFKNASWPGSGICRLSQFVTAQELRMWPKCHFYYGGWHFSYMGGLEAISDKLDAFSHQEFNTVSGRELVYSSFINHTDNNGNKFDVVPYGDIYLPEDVLPRDVIENADYYKAIGYLYD